MSRWIRKLQPDAKGSTARPAALSAPAELGCERGTTRHGFVCNQSRNDQMIRFFLLLSVFLSILFPSIASTQEWPRFRGEGGQGIGRMTQLPAEFTKAAYDWVMKLDGVGHSSPVLWGEQLFITISSGDGSERRIESYD